MNKITGVVSLIEGIKHILKVPEHRTHPDRYLFDKFVYMLTDEGFTDHVRTPSCWVICTYNHDGQSQCTFNVGDAQLLQKDYQLLRIKKDLNLGWCSTCGGMMHLGPVQPMYIGGHTFPADHYCRCRFGDGSIPWLDKLGPLKEDK